MMLLERDHLLRIAYRAGYIRAMESRVQTDIEILARLETELVQLKRAKKEALLQLEVAQAHLRNLEHRITTSEEHLDAYKHGQLAFDLRPVCELA